jgi:hypothetical protein
MCLHQFADESSDGMCTEEIREKQLQHAWPLDKTFCKRYLCICNDKNWVAFRSLRNKDFSVPRYNDF